MKILFVCSGNTGRSPMAQFIMQKLIADAGLSDEISVSSAASKPNASGILHQGIATKLRMEKIPFGEHTAHTITPEDYATSDLIVCMDKKSAAEAENLVGDADGKIKTLLDTDIPWDTNAFATTYAEIMRGCKSLLEKISARL